MKVITVCGSSGKTSANRAGLDVAARHLQGSAESSVVDASTFVDIPAFRADHVDEPPQSVAEFRGLLESADLILVAAPEYAGGVAGSTKNALDWLVWSGSLYHRVVAVMSVGTTGGEFAIEQLVRTLSWQGALVVRTLGVSAPKTKTDEAGRFTDAETIAQIEQWAAAASDAVGAPPAELLRQVTAIVNPYGIDPARFGDLS